MASHQRTPTSCAKLRQALAEASVKNHTLLNEIVAADVVPVIKRIARLYPDMDRQVIESSAMGALHKILGNPDAFDETKARLGTLIYAITRADCIDWMRHNAKHSAKRTSFDPERHDRPSPVEVGGELAVEDQISHWRSTGVLDEIGEDAIRAKIAAPNDPLPIVAMEHKHRKPEPVLRKRIYRMRRNLRKKNG